MKLFLRISTTIFVIMLAIAAISGVQGQARRFSRLASVEAKECNAAFRLPANFTKKVDALPKEDGPGNSYLYSVVTKEFSAAVQCSISPWKLNDKDTLDFAYDVDSSGILSDPQNQILAVKQIQIQGQPARQIEASRLNGTVYMRNWMIDIGDFRYLLTFMSYKKKDVVEPEGDIRDLMMKFFDSFKITKPVVPIQISYLESLPQGYAGRRTGNKYLNEAFGFDLETPVGWSDLIDSEIKRVVGSQIESTNKRVKFVVPLYYSLKSPKGQRPFGGLLILIQKNIFRAASLKTLVEGDRDNAVRDLGVLVSEDISEVTINGHLFQRFAAEKPLGNEVYKQIDYVTFADGFIIHFQLQYFDEQELRELEAVIKTLRFNR